MKRKKRPEMAGVLTGQSPGSSNIGRRPMKQRHYRKEE